ncbi:hypothetical protein HYI18_02935 [Clostridium botulinum]|uniref:ATP-binding protein n=1 Tax=Clostridium botulinum TaxID=1491 RepID=UPI00174BE918|nr:ATP-binding protein [Clostridium botulinum]MBD5637572.1 hypothetical protein [Clostridium botulinum]
MVNFYIQKITASGPGKEDSTVEFTPGLTVITGPSNTGKTCIVKCINYIFGNENLPFSEKTGYKKVSMVVQTSNGSVNFERLLEENKIIVDSFDSRIESGKYNAKNGKKIISSVWLKLIGIPDEHKIISSQNFATQRLTWRTFLHTLMIDEHEIDREESILLPKGGKKRAMGMTPFLSSLLFLIYKKDFSEFDTKESKQERAIRKASVEKYINQKLSSLADQKLNVTNNLNTFKGIDVEEEIKSLINSLSETEESLSGAMERSKSLLDEIFNKEERLAECNLLYSRYQSLRSQYTSDIKRLSFIAEGQAAMQKVPYDAKCPFCNGHLQDNQNESYAEAASAELRRIISQLSGLSESNEELINQRNILVEELSTLNDEKAEIEQLINTELKPRTKELNESIVDYRAYIQLQNELDIIHRFASNCSTDLINIQNEEVSDVKFKPMNQFDDEFWSTMNTYLMEVLEDCNYSPLVSVRLSKDSFDIEVNGNSKAINQGKGYCAFLNTVVVLAFRKFMANKAVYNPSFFVIDTPLLGFDEGSKSQTPMSLQKGLFQYFIDNQSEGQLIVIENSNSAPKLTYSNTGAKEIKFTKDITEGRYGFLHGVRDDTAQ